MIRLKGNGGAGFLCVADDFEIAGSNSAFKPLEIGVFAVTDFHLQPFRQGVDHRRADAVQAAGDLISASTELTARM